MSDVSQLQSDLTDLQTAVSDDQAAIQSVQAFAQAQDAEILNLQQQLATLQSTGGGNLDLSGLEASIAALKQNNQVLKTIVAPTSSTGTGDSGQASGADSGTAGQASTDAGPDVKA